MSDLLIKCYEFKPGSRIKGDPNVIGKALGKIEDEVGEINPENIVEAARSKDNPLHNHFTWNDTEAAKKYRLDQARYLMRNVEIVWTKKTINVDDDSPDEYRTRAYTAINIQWGSVAADDDEHGSYCRTDRILSDPQRRELLYQRAVRELISIRRRYKVLKELGEIFSLIDDLDKAG